jgi:hypothetical protein
MEFISGNPDVDIAEAGSHLARDKLDSKSLSLFRELSRSHEVEYLGDSVAPPKGHLRNG